MKAASRFVSALCIVSQISCSDGHYPHTGQTYPDAEAMPVPTPSPQPGYSVKGFLTAQELQSPQGLDTWTADELPSKLKKGDFQSRTDGIVDACVKRLLNEQAKAEVYYEMITYSGDIDLSSCVDEEYRARGYYDMTIKATLIYQDVIVCKSNNRENSPDRPKSEFGSHLDAYSDRPKGDFDPDQECLNGYSILSNRKTDISVKGQVQDQLISFSKSEVQSKSDSLNSFCSVENRNGTMFSHGCIEITRTSSKGENTVSEFKRLIHSNLTWNPGDSDVYYNSGRMVAIINGWNGLVDFHGIHESPTYSLSFKGEKAEGAID